MTTPGERSSQAPRYSVIVPLYNKGPYIERCLKSVQAQTCGDFECIIVDDGSTDEGAALCAAYLKDARFRLLRQANAGPGAARNAGAEAARGRWLGFLDADDEWLPSLLQSAEAIVDEQGDCEALVVSYYEKTGDRLASPGKASAFSYGSFRCSEQTTVSEFVARLTRMLTCTTLLRAETFKTFGGFYEKDRCVYGEDSYLWARVMLSGKILFSPERLAIYHRDASDLTAARRALRPLEPIVTDPETIVASAPAHLINLIDGVIAYKTMRSVCMLGLWGHWRKASELRQDLHTGRLPRSQWLLAILCSSRLSPLLGRIWRAAHAIQPHLRSPRRAGVHE